MTPRPIVTIGTLPPPRHVTLTLRRGKASIRDVCLMAQWPRFSKTCEEQLAAMTWRLQPVPIRIEYPGEHYTGLGWIDGSISYRMSKAGRLQRSAVVSCEMAGPLRKRNGGR